VLGLRLLHLFDLRLDHRLGDLPPLRFLIGAPCVDGIQSNIEALRYAKWINAEGIYRSRRPTIQ
jgi:hypothetical protein